jgi:hypothetical protein
MYLTMRSAHQQPSRAPHLDSKPNRLMAVATTSSKKLLALIRSNRRLGVSHSVACPSALVVDALAHEQQPRPAGTGIFAFTAAG